MVPDVGRPPRALGGFPALPPDVSSTRMSLRAMLVVSSRPATVSSTTIALQAILVEFTDARPTRGPRAADARPTAPR
jgi:hypothetical protein